MREGNRQSDEHWYCFGAHMGYSEHTDIILNWIELNWTKESAQKADPAEENSPIFLAGKVQLSDHKSSALPLSYPWSQNTFM